MFISPCRASQSHLFDFIIIQVCIFVPGILISRKILFIIFISEWKDCFAPGNQPLPALLGLFSSIFIYYMYTDTRSFVTLG